ncbi:hypothetical protein INB76_000444 [Escherichia coli]|nr:hypothetical protein [Escherichia coli]EGJ4985183.1 hypothetical protein [Escherichia coli]EGJ4998971.1 hypothetical protein [Escherichia coli]EGJ6387302.1 hypothetical protein [Escherichia coli]EGJ6415319.1 hypothetical protein [Escherichia coli]
MLDQKFVEISVWRDRECSSQIVEFDLPDSVCNNADAFLSEVNSFLIDNEFIENIHPNFLTNLEFSEVLAIISSKDIICDHYKVDRETKELEKVISRSRKMIICARNKS